MEAGSLISDNTIPSVSLNDTGLKAMSLMDVFKTFHLPVVSDEKYWGIISDTDIYDAGNLDDKIGEYVIKLPRPYVHKNQHLYEILLVAKRYGISVVPILDLEYSYIGTVRRSDVALKLADIAAIGEPGGIIVLDMCEADISLSQVAQIIESNDAKVLSLFLSHPSRSSKKVDVTIKVNKVDVSSIIQTFERFDYLIKASFMDESQIDGLYDDRYDQFMRFINI